MTVIREQPTNLHVAGNYNYDSVASEQLCDNFTWQGEYWQYTHIMSFDPHIPNEHFFLLEVKVIVVDKAGWILMLRRSGKVSRAGGWDFPGGGVDGDESPEAAVSREVREETGLDVTDVKLLNVHHDKIAEDDVLFIGYAVCAPHIQVELSWKHDLHEWMPLDKALSLELPVEYRTVITAYAKLARQR